MLTKIVLNNIYSSNKIVIEIPKKSRIYYSDLYEDYKKTIESFETIAKVLSVSLEQVINIVLSSDIKKDLEKYVEIQTKDLIFYLARRNKNLVYYSTKKDGTIIDSYTGNCLFFPIKTFAHWTPFLNNIYVFNNDIYNIYKGCTDINSILQVIETHYGISEKQSVEYLNDFFKRNILSDNISFKYNNERRNSVISYKIGTSEHITTEISFFGNGYCKLLKIIPILAHVKNKGGILFINDINDGFHPLLTKTIIKEYIVESKGVVITNVTSDSAIKDFISSVDIVDKFEIVNCQTED